MNPIKINGFKAYDLRGRIPDELNEDVAYRVGRAYAEFVKPKKVIVGRDIRLSSEELGKALEQGLLDSGVDVYDIGLCGTEVVYFATFAREMDGGIMVTASHNPPDYNGMKFVREGSRPISGDNGLQDIRRIAEEGKFTHARARRRTLRRGHHARLHRAPALVRGSRETETAQGGRARGQRRGRAHRGQARALPAVRIHQGRSRAGRHLPERRAEPDAAREPPRAGRGAAPARRGPRDLLGRRLRPLLPVRRAGTFIEGYYIVGLLASVFLARHPGSRIIHDPRLTWNTLDIVANGKGEAVQSKSGHAFMKQVMRDVDGIYGGEMSAHHYFRDFAYCDSGMIPWLVVLQVMSETGKTLSQLVGERMRLFPASGEINRRVPDAKATIAAVLAKYQPGAKSVDHTDGVSVEFERWRFNLRSSNTEPLIRLNVESRGDEALMREKTTELLALVGGEPG